MLTRSCSRSVWTIEAIHSADAALAVANALTLREAWCRILLIGGGKECQLTYRQYYERILQAMGIDMLPEEAFSQKEYCTDWLDTEESQRLFQYQRHTFNQIVQEIAATLGWRKFLVPLVRPFVRRSILNLSPYWKANPLKQAGQA